MGKVCFFFCLLNVSLLFSENMHDDALRYLKGGIANMDDDIIYVEEVEYIDDGSRFVIKDISELSKKETLALQGNPRAVDNLIDHYVYIQDIDNALRISKINYWLEILVENDITPRSQYNYYAISKCYNLNNQKRSLFWLYMSAAQHDNMACLSIKTEKKRIVFTIASDNEYPIEELKDGRLLFYEDGALRGSGTAAYSLGKYYEQTEQKDKASYWFRIGAQNGNTKCQYEYSQYLLNSNKENDRIRSEFWIRKVVKKENAEVRILGEQND